MVACGGSWIGYIKRLRVGRQLAAFLALSYIKLHWKLQVGILVLTAKVCVKNVPDMMILSPQQPISEVQCFAGGGCT